MNTFLTPDGLPILDTVHCCDALTLLRALPDNSIHCIVTSPPYYALRDYGVDGQIGLERTPQEFVAALAAVLSEARRVLRDDGVIWVNLGDSYNGGGTHHGTNNTGMSKSFERAGADWTISAPGLPPKSLLGIPWRVAFALQDAGWILRSEIIWHKPNPMPESVTDRPTKAHETVFLLAKQERYWYDGEAIREPRTEGSIERWNGANHRIVGDKNGSRTGKPADVFDQTQLGDNRNKRTVWTVATEPTPFAHFATFPQKLIEPMILAGCPAKTCAKCGAGYERVVEKGEITPLRGNSTAGPKAASGDAFGRLAAGLSDSGWTPGIRQRETLGFRPTCTCNLTDTHPGVVLDMFGGSGTVGLVARRLGRSFILGDLSAEYCALARQRLAHNSDREVEKAEKGEWFTVPMFEE